MTEAPKQTAHSLMEKCPNCGEKMWAYWHTPAFDHPELGCWFVECENPNCMHDGGAYPTIEWLFKEYTVKE